MIVQTIFPFAPNITIHPCLLAESCERSPVPIASSSRFSFPHPRINFNEIMLRAHLDIVSSSLPMNIHKILIERKNPLMID